MEYQLIIIGRITNKPHAVSGSYGPNFINRFSTTIGLIHFHRLMGSKIQFSQKKKEYSEFKINLILFNC